MTNLLKRAATGAVYVALIVCSLLYGGVWAFPLLCCFLAAGAIVEFSRLGSPEGTSGLTLLLDILLSVLLILLPTSLYPAFQLFGFFIILICILFVSRCALSVFSTRPDPAGSLVTSIASIAYITLPMILTTILVMLDFNKVVLALFIMLWLNDTGAYIIGSSFGRHKMSPRISPKKSWEGLVGGLCFCAAGAAVMSPWLFSVPYSAPTVICAAVIGVIIGVVATIGDLVESMIKRSKGVKDAGHILPGHGGILDRIDSFLLASPAIFAILLAIRMYVGFPEL